MVLHSLDCRMVMSGQGRKLEKIEIEDKIKASGELPVGLHLIFQTRGRDASVKFYDLCIESSGEIKKAETGNLLKSNESEEFVVNVSSFCRVVFSISRQISVT